MTKPLAVLALTLVACGADTNEISGTWRFHYNPDQCFTGAADITLRIPAAVDPALDGYMDIVWVEHEGDDSYRSTAYSVDFNVTWDLSAGRSEVGGYAHRITLVTGASPSATARYDSVECSSDAVEATAEKLED